MPKSKVKTNQIKPHPSYFLKDGTKVPSVTQITGAFADQQKLGALMGWAHKTKDYKAEGKKAVDIGTVAHYLVECDVKEEEANLEGIDTEIIEQAYNCYYAWVQWYLQSKCHSPVAELELVSEAYQYGGKLDLVMMHSCLLWLVDIKTGNVWLQGEHLYQVAAYRQLYQENYDLKIAQVLVLQLSKDGEGYTEHWIPNGELDKGFEIFKHMREIIRIKEGR